jgi:predicted membrane channel-forming protein YqfA (hemolysin III family)
MDRLQTENISKGWVVVAAVLIIIELVSLYEAIIADFAGSERVFAVFAGLSILCFAALLYAVSVVFYGWSGG